MSIRDMNSSDNTIETIKEKFKRGVLEQYKKFIETGDDTKFREEQNRICSDGNIILPRWEIVSRKNFFGLGAKLGSERENSVGKLFLEANGGRFIIDNFCFDFSENIDISDILERSEDKQYSEITDFYNMNNRQFFEMFRPSLLSPERRNFVAECLVLDSLLEGKYEEIKDIFCLNGNDGYLIEIELQDETKIVAINNDKGIITIKQGIKEASVNFDGIYNIKDRRDVIDIGQKYINNLDVENVTYTGDQELILQLQQAMQEQFKSQQKTIESQKEGNTLEQIVEEKIGAQKIIEFMEQNNLGPHDLSLALTMICAKTTDKTNAEQHIISVAEGEKTISEKNISEQ